MNWQDAHKRCENIYHDSDLVDLNNHQDLNELFSYINNHSEFKEIFLKMHVRVEVNTDSKKSNNNNEYIFDKKSIFFRNCGSKKKRNLFDQNYEISDFESSISSEDVVTFYNSKIYNNYQCIFMVSNNTSKFDYCVKLKNCHLKLPFICKINTDKMRSRFSGDFYPDSLHNYQQDPKMSYVINSLLAITHGLARVHKNVIFIFQKYLNLYIFNKTCAGVPGLCEEMKKITGTELFNNIRQSSFTGITGEKINFDFNGDPPGRFFLSK